MTSMLSRRWNRWYGNGTRDDATRAVMSQFICLEYEVVAAERLKLARRTFGAECMNLACVFAAESIAGAGSALGV